MVAMRVLNVSRSHGPTPSVDVVTAVLATSDGEQPVRLFLGGDGWALVVGAPGWDPDRWPRPGVTVAVGVTDEGEPGDPATVIFRAASENWDRLREATEALTSPRPMIRQVYAEDVEPGMVLLVESDVDWEPPFEVTVLEVRQRGEVVSMIVVDPDGDQRGAYYAPLQQAKLVIRSEVADWDPDR